MFDSTIKKEGRGLITSIGVTEKRDVGSWCYGKAGYAGMCMRRIAEIPLALHHSGFNSIGGERSYREKPVWNLLLILI